MMCFSGYSWLWPPFRYYFKKYADFHTRVYLASEFGVASNGDPYFEDIRTGQGEWSDRLITAIKKIEEPRFWLFLEDYWLSKPWTAEEFEAMSDWEGKSVDAWRFAPGSSFVTIEGDRYVQNSKYTVSFQPTLWEKRFLLSILKPGENPWQAEIGGTARCNRLHRSHKIFFTEWHGLENVFRASLQGHDPGLTEKGKEMFHEFIHRETPE